MSWSQAAPPCASLLIWPHGRERNRYPVPASLPYIMRDLSVCTTVKYNDMKGTERYYIPGSRT